MKIVQPKCWNCNDELDVCEGDVSQIHDEGLSHLGINCDHCGIKNYVSIIKEYVYLDSEGPF